VSNENDLEIQDANNLSDRVKRFTKPVISRGAQNILKKMLMAEQDEEYEVAELVCEGNMVYVGYWRTTRAIANELLMSCLVRATSEMDGRGLERYELNEDGRKAAIDPTWINPDLAKALAERD
jgi:hypothetical protein